MTGAISWFQFTHLPLELKEVAEPCADLAHMMLDNVMYSEQLEVGLQKLLEAKDCFVRARLYELNESRNEPPGTPL